MFANVYSGKKVLVTGHMGFKGSWLCLWLLRLGAKVAGFSNELPSEPAHFSEIKIEDKLEKHYVGDIRTYEQLDTCLQEFQPEIVFHLAAEPIVRTCYEDPKVAFDTNLGGTVNILEAVRACESVKLTLVITTDKCYENYEWEYGYRETDQLGGKDPYSASKACAEIAASAYMRSFFVHGNKKLCTARAGNVIGGGDWAKDRIIPDAVRAASKGEHVVIRCPEATRPWQHVLEPLSGYLWLGACLVNGQVDSNEAFNFGPLAEVVDTVEGLLTEIHANWEDVNWKVDPAAIREKKEASLLKLNCDKALFKLNWSAVLNFKETVEMTANWYRKFYQDKANALELSEADIDLYETLARERKAVWSLS